MDPDIGALIRRVNCAEPGAQDALFAAAYGELCRLARSRLRDGGAQHRARHDGAGPRVQVSYSVPAGGDDVLRVHEALDVLAEAEPRLAKLVEMRYFGGYPEAEIAEALELTERTLRRDWDKARLLLGALLKN